MQVDRVRPTQVFIEADRDTRTPGESAAVDIDLARNGNLGFIELSGTAPRLVRIAEQDPLARDGPPLADGPHVRAIGKRRFIGRCQSYRLPANVFQLSQIHGELENGQVPAVGEDVDTGRGFNPVWQLGPMLGNVAVVAG